MNVKSEASGLKIGVDGSYKDALVNGKWGVKLTFSGSEFNNRYEVALTIDEAKYLIKEINASFSVIDTCKKL